MPRLDLVESVKSIVLAKHAADMFFDIVFVLAIESTEHCKRLVAEYWMRNGNYRCLVEGMRCQQCRALVVA